MIARNTLLCGSALAANPVPVLPCAPFVSIPGFHNGVNARLGLSEEHFTTHCLLAGATGAGKTNALKFMLAQLISHMTVNDSMLVFDSKLDFTSNHRVGDMVISNCSPTEHVWNIFMDVVADGWEEKPVALNADEISEVIFSDAVRAGSQPFFPKAARDIFSAVVQAMTRLGAGDSQYRREFLNNRALREYLSMLDAKRLCEFLGRFAGLSGVLKYVGNGRSDQALGVFAELQSVINRVLSRNYGEDGRFSMRKAVQDRKGRIVFIEYDPSCGKSLQPVYQVLVDLYLKEVLSPRRGGTGRVYVVCDELKMLPHLNHFENALNFGRSLGVSVIAGIQSMEQLYEVYGEHGGKNIAAAFQTVFCFRTNDQATREYIQGIFGKNRSVLQYLTPSGKTAEEKITGNCVEDWDIAELKRGEAIVGIPYEKPFKFRFNRYSRR